MSASTLLASLRERGVRLYVEEGRLGYDAPSGALDGSLRAELLEHRAELTFLLSRGEPGSSPDHPDVVVSRDWRSTVAALPDAEWLRWHRRATEAIREAERSAAAEMGVDVEHVDPADDWLAFGREVERLTAVGATPSEAVCEAYRARYGVDPGPIDFAPLAHVLTFAPAARSRAEP